MLPLKAHTPRSQLRVADVGFDILELGIRAHRFVSFEVWHPDESSGLSVWVDRATVAQLHADLGEWLAACPTELDGGS